MTLFTSHLAAHKSAVGCNRRGDSSFHLTVMLIQILNVRIAPICTEITDYDNHGSHFFGLTNFPDFSSIFCSFPVFFKVLFYLKYGTIFAGFSLLLADKFP